MWLALLVEFLDVMTLLLVLMVVMVCNGFSGIMVSGDAIRSSVIVE